MSEHAVAEARETNTPQVMKRTDALQRRATNQFEPVASPEWLSDVISGDFMESSFGHDFSRVRLRADETLPLLRVRPTVQRFPRNGTTALAPDVASLGAETASTPAPAEPTTEAVSPGVETTPAPAEPTTEAATPDETPAPGLLVEDSATELAPGQMRKSEFLAELRTAVCAATEPVLTRAGRTTDGCPYLDYWFDYYSQRDAQHGERALRRYAPETARATTAREYIPIVAERVRQGVERWTRTGEITGVPEGIPITLPGMSLLGGVGSLLSGIGSIFFKTREGGTRTVNDLQVIQTQLGDGRPLDSGVRSRMEAAFSVSFGHVRAHTDGNAATLAHNLNARAFTVGEHIAFGAGEYQPGTLLGDALIAHELAHAVQQGQGSTSVAPVQIGDTSYNTLEDDADKTAVNAMVSLWDGAKEGFPDITQDAMPRLRSGLRLQRCGTTRGATSLPRTATTATTSDACPSSVELESTTNMTPGGLEKGWRTAYGIVSVMHLLPDDRNWNSAQVYERVTQASSTCPDTWNLCTGTDRPFPIGEERYSTILGTLPARRNRFYDFHTSRWRRSRLHDSDQNPTGMDSCRAVCNQRYVCGSRELGRFTITRNFRKDVYRGRDVTIVDVTKT